MPRTGDEDPLQSSAVPVVTLGQESGVAELFPLRGG
jgi:hypothetical protein